MPGSEIGTPRAPVLAFLALVVAAGCHDGAGRRAAPTTPSEQTKESATMMQMRKVESVSMVDGPAIEPSGPLLTWLEENAKSATGKRRLFRLPVVVRFENQRRLALGAAFVGVSEGDLGAQPIPLDLDDTGMSTALLDTLRDLCPRTQDACALWLDGYWGPLVTVPMPDQEPPGSAKRWPFAVLKVGAMIDPQAHKGADTRAMVEADS